jgi:hypothetical protein
VLVGELLELGAGVGDRGEGAALRTSESSSPSRSGSLNGWLQM